MSNAEVKSQNNIQPTLLLTEATVSENNSSTVDQKNMPEIEHPVYFKVYYWEIVVTWFVYLA